MTKQLKSAILKKARFLAAPEMKTIEIGVVGKFEGKNPIGAADLEWIFACNCEGTEQLRKFYAAATYPYIIM